MAQDYNENARKWLEGDFDQETKMKVIELRNNDPAGFEDAFYKTLEFGTGGLRGIMGVGTNRMNKYTVGMATQGLANYILKKVSGDDIRVCISYDSRNNSKLFAKIAADIFSANGLHVFIFENLRPTPELSYSIRKMGAVAGVMVTASHNPKEYNGYKVYWSDGAQITAPVDQEIINEVNRITDPSQVMFEKKEHCGEVELMGKEMDDAYLSDIISLTLSPEAREKHKDLKIVYTPLHGAGRVMIPRSLAYWGFDNVHCVPEQMIKDGNFPTVDRPNPEFAEALTLGLRDAKALDADILMASDPDADRVGMACKNDKGEWVLINGNQTCMIFLWYIIANRKATGKLKPTDFIVKTIVTTELIKKIADKQGVEMRDCYTGFKWIAREILLSEGKQQYIGGGEESYGFLAEDFVRDKDAVSACSLLAEICAYAKDKGKTLYDILMDIYKEYGFSKEFTINVERPGKSGAEEIQNMMTNFRANPPKELGGSRVVLWKDYKTLQATDAEGNTTALNMPETSNVLQWFCDDDTKVSVRPSGTEPKIKFYIEVKGTMTDASQYEQLDREGAAKVEAIKKSLGL